MNLMKRQSAKDNNSKLFSFRHWFSLTFTLFSLYLMGDAFYRWDAFKFHSSLSEYIPSVALALILWSIVALLCSILTWLPLKAFERICGYSGLKIKIEHLALYFSVFILMATLAWTSKVFIWSNMNTSLQLKLTVIVFISGTALPLAWMLRNKAGPWFNAIHERIKPLAWFFAICVMLSLPLVGFYKWENSTDKVMLQKPTESTLTESGKERPNILLVTYDTLTARNMSAYGYNRNTTPFIEKWAKAASLFKRVQAESNYTAATTPSLMTGKRTWTHRKYHHDLAAKPFKSATENLALVLKENGYYNAAFIQNIVTPVNALGISGSVNTAPPVIEFMRPATIEGLIEKYLFLSFADKFTTYNWLGQDDFIFTIALRRIDKKIFVTEFPPELAFNRFLEVMDNNPQEPFFVWIHLMPPHTPQAPPPPFAGTFNPSWELREKNDMYSINPEINEYSSKGLPFPEELRRQIALLRDYYDEFVLYCDNQFENFVGELQKRDWVKNTIIILSSDHGESFEHDYFLHSPTHLYEQVTHIPLIIKEPDQTEGRIIDDIVEQVDIPVTILDLADIPIPSWMEGRSLLPLMQGKELPAKTAISVSLYRNASSDPITKGAIAMWKDDYKLIHYLENEKSLLFNLKKDPGELNNLFNKEPVIGQRLLKLIYSNLKQVNERIIADRKDSPNHF